MNQEEYFFKSLLKVRKKRKYVYSSLSMTKKNNITMQEWRLRLTKWDKAQVIFASKCLEKKQRMNIWKSISTIRRGGYEEADGNVIFHNIKIWGFLSKNCENGLFPDSQIMI